MTTGSPDVSVIQSPVAAPTKRRAVLWALHVTVKALAILSLAAHGFGLWIDLHPLGAFGPALEFIWTAATLAVPFCAGPRLGKIAWQPGLSPTWAKRLLWPTYVLLACLAVNVFFYLSLLRHDLVDPMVPAPLLVGLLLGAWAIMTRRWMRRAEPSDVPHRRLSTRLMGATFAALAIAVAAVSCGLCNFTQPLPAGQNADVAVVLGGGMNDDASASVDLANRVRLGTSLYHAGRVGRIILSGYIWPPGNQGGKERSELAAMYAVCMEEKIPESAIEIDPIAINTRATAFDTITWMRAHHFTTAVLCTSDYHLYRTARSFDAYTQPGMTFFALPAAQPDWPCVDPKNLVRELVANVVYTVDPHYREPMAMNFQLSNPRVVVKKSAGTLELFDGETLKKSYKCITGKTAGDKQVEGDRKTPEGTFHIVYKNPFSNYHLSLGLDYPNREDADRGLKNGDITQQQHDDILAALASDLTKVENQKKLWYTKLGGEIFIHGYGDGRAGTAGCVALSNADVEELYAALPLGTEVEISP